MRSVEQEARTWHIVWSLLLGVFAMWCCPAPGVAAPALLNGSFETGTITPKAWTPGGDGGQTAWEPQGHIGQRSISVSGGKPGEAVYWQNPTMKLTPGQTYRFAFWSKAENAGTGCIISGLSTANCDFPFSSQWKRYSYVFTAPQSDDAYLRLGQWDAKGKVFFDDVSLSKAMPQQLRAGVMELGEGEHSARGAYSFSAPLATSNASRPLLSATAGFNSSRWVLNGDAIVIYRHRIGDYMQRSAALQLNVNYYVAGKLTVEASRDGNAWLPVAQATQQGTVAAALPSILFPAPAIWVRLRSASSATPGHDSSPGSLQINSYNYTAQLDGTPPDASGRTVFLEEKLANVSLPVSIQTLGDLRPGGHNEALLTVTNTSSQPVPLQAALQFTPNAGVNNNPLQNFVAAPGKTSIKIPYALHKAGTFTVGLTVTAERKPVYAAQAEFTVPAMLAADYGYALPKMRDVWWAESAYKISRERPVPQMNAGSKAAATALYGMGTLNPTHAAQARAARNEYESLQIVARPDHDVKQVMVSCAGLNGPGDERISPTNISICAVDYVPVTQATDSAGATGDWPDPLSPLTHPINLQGGRNQPFWITIYVPENAAPGLYFGIVKMAGEGWQQAVPLSLWVRDFALPRETHVQSAFGFSPDSVRRYQNLQTPEQMNSVMGRYYQNFAEHRISPYDPVFNAPIKVDFGLRWQGGELDAKEPFVGAHSLRVTDDSPKAVLEADYGAKLAVTPDQPYTLKFAARTAQAGQKYQVTLTTYDANGNWLPGHNLDVTREGSGQWEQVAVDVAPHLTPQMRFVKLYLRPVPWSEDGSGVGTAWFDEIGLYGADGKNLLTDGGFEQVAPAGEVKIDFTAFDAAMTHALAQYHFTSWRLPLEAMGGGTFQERSAGRIGSYVAGTPEYEALFGSYLRQLQDHLAQKGWLDKAYLYWFDEPDKKDYAFVREGMKRIKKYAPKLTRMLTVEPEPGLVGAVDLWCPITNKFDPVQAAARQRAGDRVWWYICTGPKAPYAGEFIDHPAVEPRAWLWQTWKYGVQGILIWETAYWNSPTAYPTTPQNPWQDPMSWASGYGLAPGTKAPWGNGDGRFFYPPNRAGEGDKTTHLDGPINSIRFEMLRDGIEDYEYFYLLRQEVNAAKKRGLHSPEVQAAEKLLEVPASVTTSLTSFAAEPQPMLQHREKLADAIAELAALLSSPSAPVR